MKAPNKIYIDDLAVVNDCSTKISTKPLSDFSEYIRKDVLMKWLDDSIKEMDEDRKKSVAYSLQSMAGAIAISSFIEVKDKLNSM